MNNSVMFTFLLKPKSEFDDISNTSHCVASKTTKGVVKLE